MEPFLVRASLSVVNAIQTPKTHEIHGEREHVVEMDGIIMTGVTPKLPSNKYTHLADHGDACLETTPLQQTPSIHRHLTTTPTLGIADLSALSTLDLSTESSHL